MADFPGQVNPGPVEGSRVCFYGFEARAQSDPLLAGSDMQGEPHSLLLGMGPIHTMASLTRNEHMIPGHKIDFFPGAFKKKPGASAQNDHPLRNFRAKPFTFRRCLPQRNDPLDLETLSPSQGLEHLPLLGGGKPGKNVAVIDL